VLVGATTAVGLFVVLGDPLLAGVTGLFWATGLGLTARHLRQDADRVGFAADDWSVARWRGAFGGSMALAAVVGAGPTLPLSTDLRLALGLLIVGVALTSLDLGTAMVVEARRGDRPA